MFSHDFNDRSLFPRVMTISSAHLSDRTARQLQMSDAADFPSLGGHWGRLGWMLWVDVEFGMAPGCRPDLRDIFEFADIMDAEIVVLDEGGQMIPELKVYREHVVESCFDEYSNRERSTDAELEDMVAFLALEELSRNSRFQATPSFFVTSMQAIVSSLALHCRKKPIIEFSFDTLLKLSDLACVFRLCVHRTPQNYLRTYPSVISLSKELDDLIKTTSFDCRGLERKIEDAISDTLFRLGAATALLKTQAKR